MLAVTLTLLGCDKPDSATGTAQDTSASAHADQTATHLRDASKTTAMNEPAAPGSAMAGEPPGAMGSNSGSAMPSMGAAPGGPAMPAMEGMDDGMGGGAPPAMGAAAAGATPPMQGMDDGMGGMGAGAGAMAGPPAAMGSTPGAAAAPAPMVDDMDEGMGMGMGGVPGAGGMAAPAGGGGMMAMMGMCCGGAPAGAQMPGKSSMPGMSADAKTDPSAADTGMGPAMGKMPGTNKMPGKKMMSMPTLRELPGFPGAPHLYHAGSVDFFLDRADALALTTDQKAQLERRRAEARMASAATAAHIVTAETRLWALTGSDRPVADRIVATVTEIERLKTTQRLEFMRAVGAAIAVLDDVQRSCASTWADASGTGMIDASSTAPATCPGIGS